MLGLPIDAIMSQFAPLTGTGKPPRLERVLNAILAAMAPQVPEVKKKPKAKSHDLSQSLQAPSAALAGKLTTEQQFKLLELEKSLEGELVRLCNNANNALYL